MIREKLPKKGQKSEIETRLVQVHLERDFVERVDAIRKNDKLTWNELIQACLEAYCEESQKSTKRRAS